MKLLSYGNTDTDLQGHKQGFWSEIILDVYAIHLKKVDGSWVNYGNQVGALALCTTA